MKKEIKNKRVPIGMLIDTGTGPEFFCALCTVNGIFGKTAFLTREEAEKARNQLN